MKYSVYFFLVLAATFSVISCKSDIKKKEVQIISESEKEIVQPISNPITGNSSLPRLFAAKDQLYMSWVERKDSLAVLNYSIFKDGDWTSPTEINSGKDWFVNWADFPAIAENNGNILTSYLQKSATGTYTYDVKLNIFSEAKQAWKRNTILNNDGTQSEHGFVAMLPYGEDSFFVTWLDGRNTVNVPQKEMQMTLRGAVVNVDGTITKDSQLDKRVCDCCSTSAAMTANGPVVVYRDRSEEEIRDISMVRWVNDKWTSPKTIAPDNWKISGCPVNGPAISAYKNNLAVAWFTAADSNAMVKLIFSENNGETFGAPIQINTTETLGRVDVAMVSEYVALVCWMEKVGEETLIQLMKVSSDGTKSFPVTVSRTSAKRSSGFPQMELMGNAVYMAWTAVEGENSSVKTAYLSVNAL